MSLKYWFMGICSLLLHQKFIQKNFTDVSQRKVLPVATMGTCGKMVSENASS